MLPAAQTALAIGKHIGRVFLVTTAVTTCVAGTFVAIGAGIKTGALIVNCAVAGANNLVQRFS